jgi:hypothetical protein
MLQITLLLLLFFSWSNALKLGPEGVYNIEWEVSGDKKVITFELTVRSLGYIGLGVSPNGTMVGADIAAVEIRENGSGELTVSNLIELVLCSLIFPKHWTKLCISLQDRYAIGHYTPTRDDENNLSLLSFKRNETSTYVKFSRPLVTGDSLHDQPIHVTT